MITSMDDQNSGLNQVSQENRSDLPQRVFGSQTRAGFGPVNPFSKIGNVFSSAGNFFKPKFFLIFLPLLLLILIFALTIKFYVIPRFSKPSEITLIYWGLWEDEATVKPLIEEYESKHPNIKINYIRQDSQDYRERLQNSFAQGKGPDIFRFHNSWVPMLSADFSVLPPDVMDASTFAKTFYSVFSVDLVSKNKIIGIPLEIDGLGLFINDDIFNSKGKTPPKTWDEFRKTAVELTDPQGPLVTAGTALGTPKNVDHWQDILALMMLQNGASLSQPSGKLAEDALTFFTLFTKNLKVWDETLPPSTLYFESGKLAMYFGPSWRVFEIKQKSPGLKFKVVPVPQLPKTDAGEPDVNWASYWAEGVWNKSKNQKAAWDFLVFLASKESLEKFYQNAAKTRLFGEPYSRRDMASLLQDDPYVGTFIRQAETSRSWYLASRTFDGPTGINSKISKYFEDAINSVNKGNDSASALKTVVLGLSPILSQYGISK